MVEMFNSLNFGKLDGSWTEFIFIFIYFLISGRSWVSLVSHCEIMDFSVMDFSAMDRGQLTLLGSGLCVMLTMHFTVQLLSQHLFYWKNPKEQKAIIIIILMAPIYAMDSFVGLLDIQGSKAFFMFLDSIKECYEALVSSFDLESVMVWLCYCLH